MTHRQTTVTLGDEDQAFLLGKKKHVSSKLFSYNWTILAIILAQISICIFAWAFAGVMMHKTIALPDSAARWVQNHSSDTQTVVTSVSTILALTSSL